MQNSLKTIYKKDHKTKITRKGHNENQKKAKNNFKQLMNMNYQLKMFEI